MGKIKLLALALACCLALYPAFVRSAYEDEFIPDDAQKMLDRAVRAGNRALNPAYKPVVLTSQNSPLTVQIVGVVTTAPNATVRAVRVPYNRGSFSAAISADKLSIILTLVNPSRLTKRYNVAYDVREPGPVTYTGILGVSGAGGGGTSTPSGPVNTFGGALLGVPLLLPASEVLAGWSDADGNEFGITLARVRGLTRGQAKAMTVSNRTWTSVRSLQNKRITELTYTCWLWDLRRGYGGSGAPRAKEPACLSSGATMDIRVTDSTRRSRHSTTKIQPVGELPFYAHPLLNKFSGSSTRRWASKLGISVASNPTVTASSVTWPAIGTADVSPPASTSTPRSLVFTPSPSAADPGYYEASATLTFAPGAAQAFTYAAAQAAIYRPGSGVLKMTVTVRGGANGTTYTLPYGLVTPLPKRNARAYAGTALFGVVNGSAAITSLTVIGQKMGPGSLLVIEQLDASSSTPLYPDLTPGFFFKQGADGAGAEGAGAG